MIVNFKNDNICIVRIKIVNKNQIPSRTLDMDWELVPDLIRDSKTALIAAIIIGILIKELFGLMFPDIGYKIYKQLYFLLLIIPVHELLHILFFPKKSTAIIWVNFKKILVNVTSDGEFSKTRLKISLLAPFISLTLLPFIISIWHENQILVSILLYNALASGGDILSFITVISTKGSVFTINGEYLFAKRDI